MILIGRATKLDRFEILLSYYYHCCCIDSTLFHTDLRCFTPILANYPIARLCAPVGIRKNTNKNPVKIENDSRTREENQRHQQAGAPPYVLDSPAWSRGSSCPCPCLDVRSHPRKSIVLLRKRVYSNDTPTVLFII